MLWVLSPQWTYSESMIQFKMPWGISTGDYLLAITRGLPWICTIEQRNTVLSLPLVLTSDCLHRNGKTAGVSTISKSDISYSECPRRYIYAARREQGHVRGGKIPFHPDRKNTRIVHRVVAATMINP